MSAIQRAAICAKTRLDELIAKAEEPAKLMRHVAADLVKARAELEAEIEKGKLEAASVIEEGARQRHLAKGWEVEAMKAVRAQDDPTAMEALRMKKRCEQEAEAAAARKEELRTLLKNMITTSEVLARKHLQARAAARIIDALRIPSQIGRDPAAVLELISLLEERAIEIEVASAS